MDEKIDFRVYKTRKALVNALYELLCEKSFDKLSVTELCERAEVRKATFYKHFGDKNELFSYMVKDLQQKNMEDKVIEYDPENPKTYYIQVFRFFIGFLADNEYMIRQVINSSAGYIIIDLLSEQMELDLKLHIQEDMNRGSIPEGEPQMLASTYTGAMIYCGKWWIMQDKRPAKELIVKQFTDIIGKLLG